MIPVDQMSERMVYVKPDNLSGCAGRRISQMGLSNDEEWAYSHVKTSASERARVRVDELSRDTKIAKLDVTPGVDQDIGRLDVAMHDAQFMQPMKPA